MAHVMAYPEILDAANNGSIIWEELRLRHSICPMKFDGVDFVGIKDHNKYLLLMECDETQCMDYNLYYRCWDKEPTDEEREAAPWKDDPYKFLRGDET